MKTFILSISLFCIVSCKEQINNKQLAKTEQQDNNPIKLPPDFNYIITETRENAIGASISVIIEINQKLSKEQLTYLSNKIKSNQKHSKVFIHYSLPQNTSGISWATAQYNPSLKLEITGTTLEDEQKINAMRNQIDSEIIGCWYEEEYTSSTIILYKKEGKNYIKTLRKKWNSNEILSEEKCFTQTEQNNGFRLDYENKHGEYYVMSKDKERLMFYNSDDKCFTTALPLKSDLFDTKNSARNKSLEIKGNTSDAYTIKKADADMARNVFVISKEFVIRALKDPKSAEFSSDYDVSVTDNNIYTISSYVNATNSYGVKTKTTFKLKLKFKGGEWSDYNKWELLTSDFE